MTKDMRKKVVKSRKLLKKIERAIPGFRGYRGREDLRAADSIIRENLADKISDTVSSVERCRKDLAKNMVFEVLEDTADTINTLQSLESQVRHAEQGYSGLSSDVSLEEDELNKLYRFDLKMLNYVEKVDKKVEALENSISSGDTDKIDKKLDEIDKFVDKFERNFKKRTEVIKGTYLK